MILIGIDFLTTPIEIRENLYFGEEDFPLAYERLGKMVSEVVILSTCNRMEIYFHGNEDKAVENKVIAFLNEYYLASLAKKLPLENQASQTLRLLEDHFYFAYGGKAINHLYEVSVSLKSLVVGENEILGQVKKAYEVARLNKVTDAYFNKLFQGAIAIGKKVRTETNISKGGVSIASTSVDLIKEIYKKNSEFSLLLIGAGEVAEGVAKSLVSHGEVTVTICNRTESSAVKLIDQYGGRWVPFANRYTEIVNSDVIISATSFNEPVITCKEFTKHRDGYSRFTFFIDLSVPRDIDSSINELDDTALYTIDNLQAIANKNIEARSLNIKQAKLLINLAVEEFHTWSTNRLKYFK